MPKWTKFVVDFASEEEKIVCAWSQKKFRASASTLSKVKSKTLGPTIFRRESISKDAIEWNFLLWISIRCRKNEPISFGHCVPRLNSVCWVPCHLSLESRLYHPAFVECGNGAGLAVLIEQRKIEPLVNLYLLLGYLHLNLRRVYSGL